MGCQCVQRSTLPGTPSPQRLLIPLCRKTRAGAEIRHTYLMVIVRLAAADFPRCPVNGRTCRSGVRDAEKNHVPSASHATTQPLSLIDRSIIYEKRAESARERNPKDAIWPNILAGGRKKTVITMNVYVRTCRITPDLKEIKQKRSLL